MRRALLILGVGLIAAALAVVPMPVLEVEPGEALSVPDRLALDAQAADADLGSINGDLLLTTVRVGSPTAIEMVEAWLDGSDELVLREAVVPPGVDEEEFFRRQRLLFEESLTVAAAVAQRAAGLDVRIDGDGALVAGILDGSPADGELQVGDVITGVDEDPVRLAADVGVAIAGADAGEPVRLRIDREGEELTVEVTLEQLEEVGQPAIGVALQTAGREIDLPIAIEVADDGVGGPSAGLMAALAVYDIIVDTDLVAGRRIAGTGTMGTRGRVGSVNGIEQKVEVAEAAGASIFLAPAEQVDIARRAASPDLEVIGVRTLEQALDELDAG